jgi:hypothetical protein
MSGALEALPALPAELLPAESKSLPPQAIARAAAQAFCKKERFHNTHLRV